ncbi:MAG: hypothetical protein ACE362_10570 [Phaeodactylibacter xiamenensis]|uniref:Uncharacterized protein n=1 Tax=Phaeodactylibacter xiamenensis TaxID=1524460 RepID=A0A098S4P6_9BACT|nr:hypothetical protein [Phaeodactylibacter xiamenensis]KGE87011.1 hypothetical protein IX84_18475 [Phaeodactylibacter xiamenensis]MCR9050725.1 hypothetical protein [bacterium]
MKRPVAFQLLQSFRSSEIQLFHVFLESPAFNRRQEMPLLLDYWRQNRAEPPDARAIFKAACPGQPFRKQDYYLLLSRFHKLAEQFLAWQAFQQNEQAHYTHLLQALRQRQQQPLFQRSMKKARSLNKPQDNHAADSLHFAYHLEREQYDFIDSHDRTKPTNLQQATDLLDAYYFAEKLRQTCLAHARSVINQETYKIGMIPAIEAEIKKRPSLLEHPAVLLYHACYQAVVVTGAQRSFQLLRQYIRVYKKGFPRQEIRDLYLLAINYCIRALNFGDTAFAQEALQLYEESLKEGYLLEDGYLPESTFSNMVSLALKLEYYEWVEAFIGNHSDKLKPAFRESLPWYTSAKLAYELGDTDRVLQLCAKIEARQPFLYLGTKTLQLKVLCEQEEWDAVDSLLESMRVYLQRHKDVGYHREHYLLLLQFTRRLLGLIPGDLSKIFELAAEVETTKNFREKPWMLRQISKKVKR